MTFREYLNQLAQFAAQHPEALEFAVVSSADAEGNRFDEVQFGPSIGYWDDEGDFRSEDSNDDEDSELNVTKEQYNAVCIN